jgi:hypothetical protein
MNYRSSSRLSYRNVLIAAGLAAALGAGQNPESSLDGGAGSRLNGHEGAPPTTEVPAGAALTSGSGEIEPQAFRR